MKFQDNIKIIPLLRVNLRNGYEVFLKYVLNLKYYVSDDYSLNFSSLCSFGNCIIRHSVASPVNGYDTDSFVNGLVRHLLTNLHII
jgi:hypothetical protein